MKGFYLEVFGIDGSFILFWENGKGSVSYFLNFMHETTKKEIDEYLNSSHGYEVSDPVIPMCHGPEDHIPIESMDFFIRGLMDCYSHFHFMLSEEIGNLEFLTAEQLNHLINKMQESGLSLNLISDHLNSFGLKYESGGKWTRKNLSSYISKARTSLLERQVNDLEIKVQDGDQQIQKLKQEIQTLRGKSNFYGWSLSRTRGKPQLVKSHQGRKYSCYLGFHPDEDPARALRKLRRRVKKLNEEGIDITINE